MTVPTGSTVAAVVDRVRESVGDLPAARTLPGEAYTSAAFYEFERRAVFGESWLFVCHAAQLAADGDRIDDVVAGFSLVAERSDGDIHGWLRTRHGAEALRVEVWEGLVFVHLDPDAPPLAPTVVAAQAAVAPYRLADMVVAATVHLRDLPFNWKNMQENALEEYHTTYVHRGFHENVPAHLVEHGTFERGDGAIYRHAGMIVKGGEPVPGRPTFPVIPGLPERERGYFLFLAVPPLLFAAIRPDGVKMFRIVPDAVDRMTLSISFLFPPDTLDLPDFASMLQRQIDLIELIDHPDIESNTRMYRGLQSRFAPRGPFSPQESSLPQLNGWLLDRYEAALVARAA